MIPLRLVTELERADRRLRAGTALGVSVSRSFERGTNAAACRTSVTRRWSPEGYPLVDRPELIPPRCGGVSRRAGHRRLGRGDVIRAPDDRLRRSSRADRRRRPEAPPTCRGRGNPGLSSDGRALACAAAVRKIQTDSSVSLDSLEHPGPRSGADKLLWLFDVERLFLAQVIPPEGEPLWSPLAPATEPRVKVAPGVPTCTEGCRFIGLPRVGGARSRSPRHCAAAPGSLACRL